MYPYKVAINNSIINDHKEQEFYAKLSAQSTPEFNIKSSYFSTHCIEVPANYQQTWTKLSSILNKAFQGIVKSYFNNDLIRKIYGLSHDFERILRLVEHLPYNVGMYRPDFLIARHTLQPKLCEIGARFPFNGWCYTALVSQIIYKFNKEYNLNLSPNNSHLQLLDFLKNQFNIAHNTALIFKSEKVSESYMFLNYLAQNKHNINVATPSELQLIDNKIIIDGIEYQQFILELDRSELLFLSDEILYHLTKSCFCVNDIRTLILIHDKRVLAVLNSEQIMLDILSAEDYTFLKSFLIPTFSIEQAKDLNIDFSQTTSNWLFKQNSGGKGRGMFESSTLSESDLQEFLNHEKSNYMLQEILEQEKIEVSFMNYIVGFILFYNDISYGEGLFRGGENTIVNMNGKSTKFITSIMDNA